MILLSIIRTGSTVIFSFTWILDNVEGARERACKGEILFGTVDSCGSAITELRADGGASRDNFLMQFQAISGCTIIRPAIRETTALGAACLAGLATGFWQGIEELQSRRESDAIFNPSMDPQKRETLISGWHKAVGRSRGWA